MSASVAGADREICFDVDGTATYGTLRVPAHREGQRLAAALLLPGSGPTDRNGDVPALDVKPRTLALIAEVLARLGIMSLRFDKYFTGRTGAGAYAKDPGRRRCSSPDTARVACTRCSPRGRCGRTRPGSR